MLKIKKAKTKSKVSPLNLCGKCLNKIKNEEKNKNNQIFRECFYYQIQNNKIIKYINDLLIDLRNSVNSKEINNKKVNHSKY